MVAPEIDLTKRYGRWALVAGASAGLGAAMARSAARRGFHVVLLARREALLEETAAQIHSAHGVDTRCIVADLARPDIDEVVADATDDLDLGVFVYNAAAEPAGRFLDVPLDEHRLNLAVNCWTPTVLCHRIGRKMVERGRGAIALVSSVAALQGIRMFASYGAAKSYELILGEGLWDELRAHGVDVLSYIVGATASSNYEHTDPQAYADASPEAAERAKGVLMPATPEEVAERLFERLDAGPRQFSTDEDEARASANAIRPRSEVVSAIGEVTSRMAIFRKARG
jgi:short-subunit dehydrogenase